MDILAMIASAVGGIVLWNLFFSSKKQAKCEASESTHRHPDSLISAHLEETFGTDDLDYVLKTFTPVMQFRHPDSLISAHLEKTFGTDDLDYVLKTFAPQTRKKMIEAQKSGPSR